MTAKRIDLSAPATKRVSCLGIIEVRDANPNGDPDNDARPRVIALSNNTGVISDVAIKRKYRNLFTNPQSAAFADMAALCDGIDPDLFRVVESPMRGFHDAASQTEAQTRLMDLLRDDPEYVRGLTPKYLTDHYGDVRVFGTTTLEMKDAEEDEEPEDGDAAPGAKKKAKPKKEKQRKVMVKLCGPVTITPATSLHRIVIDERTTTKLADVDVKKHDRGVGGMAPLADKRVVYGLYTFRLELCVRHAELARTTLKDVEVLKRCLKLIWDQNPSRCRPAGSIRFPHLWWGQHSNAIGSFNVFDFYNRLTPTLKAGVDQPNSIDDFVVPDATAVRDLVAVEDIA